MRQINPQYLDELRRVVGPQHVAVDPGERHTFESDAFTLVRGRPDAVVFPASTEEVAGVARITAKHGLPIIPRGAGTSLAGGTIAIDGGVCVSLTRMRQILDINLRDRFARVQAGVVNLHVSQAVTAQGWHYAPDPSSQMVSTVGGNFATNAGGPHTLRYGVTAQHVLGATIVLADGSIVALGGTYDDAPGGDVLSLLVGSEGTLGIATEITVRLTRTPAAIRTQLAIFDSIDDASHAISGIIAAGIVPAALEMMDQATLTAVEQWLRLRFPLDAGAVLIIEIDGLEPGLDRQTDRIAGLCRRHGARDVRLARDDAERAQLWMARKKSFGALGRYGLSYCTQDGVVPPSRIPELMRFIADVGARHRLRVATVMHAGDGNIHPVLMYDENDPAQVRAVVAAGYEILDRCVALGGSVTGEHGIGIEKVRHLERMYDPDTLAMFERVRRAFDPDRRLNPRKVLAGGAPCVELLRPPKGIPA